MESVYLPYATYLGARDRNVPNPYSEPTAVYMGNLYPAYDHDLLIDAAAILKQRGKLPAIQIIGGGPELEPLRTKVRELGVRVDLPGFVSGDELWRHLVHAHVLVFPIRPTILNLARCPSKTFAYAQTGRPVIANAVGEVVEVLGRGTDWPRYVDPTPQAFADALERVMDAPRARDVDYHLEHQNWDERARTLLEAIDRDRRGQNPYG
jgi:glycosyltransferase involved in cell wall biosynthesis